jgi:hypothetical protein
VAQAWLEHVIPSVSACRQLCQAICIHAATVLTPVLAHNAWHVLQYQLLSMMCLKDKDALTVCTASCC